MGESGQLMHPVPAPAFILQSLIIQGSIWASAFRAKLKITEKETFKNDVQISNIPILGKSP